MVEPTLGTRPRRPPLESDLEDWRFRIQGAVDHAGLDAGVEVVAADGPPLPLDAPGGLRPACCVLGAGAARLPAVAVTLGLRRGAWTRQARRDAVAAVEQVLRRRLAAHWAWTTRFALGDGSGRRRLGPPVLGRLRLGRAYVVFAEEAVSQPLIDQVLQAVREVVKPSGTAWEKPLRERLAPILERGRFHDGDLLTADDVNLWLDRLDQLTQQMAEVREKLKLGDSRPSRSPRGGETPL